LRKNQIGDLYHRTSRLFPTNGRLIERHRSGVGAKLNREREPHLARLQSFFKISGKIGGILWSPVDRARVHRSRQFVFDVTPRSKRKRYATPIVCGEDAVYGFRHFVQESCRDGMGWKLRAVIAVDDASFSEGPHVNRRINEENVKVLQDKIKGCVAWIAKHFWDRRVKELEPDADRRFVVIQCRQRIRRKAHPCWIFRPGKESDSQVVWQLRPNAKDTMDDSVGLQKNGSQRRALALRDAARLHHAHKHLRQRRNWIAAAIDACLAPGWVGGRCQMLHAFLQGITRTPAGHTTAL